MLRAPMLRCILLATVGLAAVGAEVEAADRTNILLIVTDNQSASLLGAYGNSDIDTPNIDAIAVNGLVFDNAFAASGVCSPTRASLLTGLMPSQTGVHNALPTDPDRIGIEEWAAIGEFRTLPYTLSEAGYETALIGKYHLGTHETPQLGFEHWVTMETGHTKSFIDTQVIDNGRRVHVTRHATDYWTDKAVEFLSTRAADRPFFLMLSYNGPYILPPVVTGASHSPHVERYVAKPPRFPQEPVHPFLRGWAIGQTPTEHMQAEATHAWAAISALNNRRAMINTAAETTTVDDGVGRIVNALRELDLEEDTLVIYTSDQGSAYGQHGLWGNTSWADPFPAYDSHMRVPLIFYHPPRVPAGRRTPLAVSQIDLFATLLDYVGLSTIEIEDSVGRSVLPTISGSDRQTERPVFFEFITTRAIRTPEWKYIERFPSGPNELYRLTEDSGEMSNLAADERFAEVSKHLGEQLSEWFGRVAKPKYDVWNGGTGKGRLIEDYGKNSIFEERFRGWRAPYIEAADPYSQ